LVRLTWRPSVAGFDKDSAVLYNDFDPSAFTATQITGGMGGPLDNTPRTRPGFSLSRLLTAVFLLAWVFIILLLFYLNHKPLPGDFLARIGAFCLPLAGAIWILWVAEGIGRPLTRDGTLNPLEKTALSGALGLGVLSLLALALAAVGWISGVAIAILLIALTIVFFRESLGWFISLVKGRSILPPPGDSFSLVCGIFVLATILLSLGVALSPPVAWDALVYHLRIPQQILAAHSLQLPGDSLFREMPNVAEMISTAALGLTGRMETATVLAWCIGVLALAGIAGTANRMGLRYPLLAPAVLLVGDTLARSMGWGYVDWVTALFGYAAICSISLRAAGWKWILLAGTYAGLAFGTKYTAGVILPVLLLWGFAGWQWKRGLREAFLLTAAFVLAFAPWIIRNLALWGNPLPPLTDANQSTLLRLWFFSGIPLPDAWMIAPVIPFLQSTVGRYEAAPFGATIGPLLLAFLPGVFFRRRIKQGDDSFPAGLLLLSAVAFWVASGLGIFFSESFAQPRLLMVLFPALALLAACGFDGLGEIRLGQVRIRVLAGTLAILTMGFQLTGYIVTWVREGVPAYLTGASDATAYLQNNLGWYALAMDSMNALPEGSRVLMLWEPRGLYCGEKCLEDSTIDRWYLATRLQGAYRQILEDWKAAGFTHVLVSNDGADFERKFRPGFSPADWEELARLRSGMQEESEFGTFYTLYRIGAD
jgi:4-amino-4-deoxy-L-arabinose transferase-like glycosyltransferase